MMTEFFDVQSEEEIEKETNANDKVVSYSQYKMWLNCPYQWKRIYADKLFPFAPSIETVFGSAMHEVIQEWLTLHFENSKKAKQLDYAPILKDKLISFFKESIIENEDGTKTYVCNAETVQEYYEDGCAILDHIQKWGKEFFPVKDYKLLGCEVKLEYRLKPNLLFKAYLDIIIHDTKNNKYYIIDLKTSRAGWHNYHKKDIGRLHQVLLYKKFWSEKFGVSLNDIIPKFIILKRKIKEQSDFIIRRISNFEPAHGSISMKKATEGWNRFINECFDDVGNYKVDNVKALPSEKSCRFCPLNDNESLCKYSYYLNKKKSRQNSRRLLNDSSK